MPLSACGGVFCSFLLQFLPAISSPSGAVSTLIGLFSFAGPALTLQCSVDSDRVVVHVIDTGIGMDAETIRRATEHGFRGGSPEVQGRPGEGLGLASAAAAAKALNASLSFEAIGERCGTTVRVALPLAAGPPSDAPHPVDVRVVSR